jgi:biopolymer transport protein TolR
MGMIVGKNKDAVADINVVPLIDILLVLIIIFMVITPTTPKGLAASIPQPLDGHHDVVPPGETVVVVQVTAGGKVMINQEETTWEQLGPRLEGVFKQRAEKVAFIQGDDGVDFADVARAIDIMRASGIEKVGLITARLLAA